MKEAFPLHFCFSFWAGVGWDVDIGNLFCHSFIELTDCNVAGFRNITWNWMEFKVYLSFLLFHYSSECLIQLLTLLDAIFFSLVGWDGWLAMFVCRWDRQMIASAGRPGYFLCNLGLNSRHTRKKAWISEAWLNLLLFVRVKSPQTNIFDH